MNGVYLGHKIESADNQIDITTYFNSILTDSAYTLKGPKSAGALDELKSSRCMQAFKMSFESKVKPLN